MPCLGVSFHLQPLSRVWTNHQWVRSILVRLFYTHYKCIDASDPVVEYNKPLHSCSGDGSPPAKSMSVGGRKIGPKRKGCHVTLFPTPTSSSPCKSIPFGVHPLLKSSALESRPKTSTALVIRTIQPNQRGEHSNGFRMEGPRAEKRENENYTGITTKRHKHERQIIKCEQSTRSNHDHN